MRGFRIPLFLVSAFDRRCVDLRPILKQPASSENNPPVSRVRENTQLKQKDCSWRKRNEEGRDAVPPRSSNPNNL